MEEKPKKETTGVNTLGWGSKLSIFVSIAAYFFSQLILIIPVVIIALFNRGQDVQNIINNNVLLNLSLASISSATIIFVLWYFLKRRGRGFKDLGFKKFKKTDFLWLTIGVAMYFVAVAVVLTIASFIPGFNENQSQDVGYQGVHGLGLILAFVGLVVLPPFAEEVLFRGFLYRGLASRWPKVISALIASLLFAVVHFQWNVGLDVFVLSLVLIFLLEKTKNLWVCILAHALKNGVAFLVLFVFT
jgi:hypothetical protein